MVEKRIFDSKIILNDAKMLEEVLTLFKWDIFPKIDGTKCFSQTAMTVPEDGTGSVSASMHMRLTLHNEDSYLLYQDTHKEGIDEYISAKLEKMEGVSVCPTVLHTEYVYT